MPLQQAELAGSLIYLSTALRCYIEEFKSLGYTKRVRYKQQRSVASNLFYRSVVLRCYRVVTRNCGEGLQIETKHAVLPDRRIRLYVTEGRFRFCFKVRPYTQFLSVTRNGLDTSKTRKTAALPRRVLGVRNEAKRKV